MSAFPILYSFRRCPYAMRARMGVLASGKQVRLREVVLRDKPDEMLEASPKATVPVLVQDDDTIIDESLAIMRWALEQNDPQSWLENEDTSHALIEEADGPFKYHLDRYKYPVRYEDIDPFAQRAAAFEILQRWNGVIANEGGLVSDTPRLADIAIFPFVRQFANHDRTWFDAQEISALQSWLEGHLESDLFQSIMPKFPQWKTGDEEPVFPLD